MPPLHSQDLSRMQQAMLQAAEAWSRHPRSPQSAERLVATGEPLPGQAETATTSTPFEPQGSAVGTEACLIKIRGEQQQTTWGLSTSRPVVLGRSGKKTTVLDIDLWPDATVSRRHALIWFDGQAWCINDLRSTNGIWLGERVTRVQRALPMALGTKMHFGLTILMLAEVSPMPQSERGRP